MDLGLSTLVIGAAIGLALGLFGARTLVTGRAPAATRRSFRTVRDAGLYHLLFGIALLILAIGIRAKGPAPTVTAVLAVAMVTVAVLRFRPRGRRARTDRAEGDQE